MLRSLTLLACALVLSACGESGLFGLDSNNPDEFTDLVPTALDCVFSLSGVDGAEGRYEGSGELYGTIGGLPSVTTGPLSVFCTGSQNGHTARVEIRMEAYSFSDPNVNILDEGDIYGVEVDGVAYQANTPKSSGFVQYQPDQGTGSFYFDIIDYGGGGEGTYVSVQEGVFSP